MAVSYFPQASWVMTRHTLEDSCGASQLQPSVNGRWLSDPLYRAVVTGAVLRSGDPEPDCLGPYYLCDFGSVN